MGYFMTGPPLVHPWASTATGPSRSRPRCAHWRLDAGPTTVPRPTTTSLPVPRHGGCAQAPFRSDRSARRPLIQLP
jgi:hypothetical protein